MNSEVSRIYYTDDDIDDREIFTDAANQVSELLQITTQGSGEELMGLLDSVLSYPDLIFLDLNMPRKNGYEILQEIKQSTFTRHLPVVIFSTSDDEKTINDARLLGANLYIPKPSSFSSLKKVIEYSLSLNWDTFTPSTEDFVYRANQLP